MKKATRKRSAPAQSALLRRLNEREVLAALQTQGPLSRAELARRTGISGSTVTRVVASLLAEKLLEECEAEAAPLGRPAKALRLGHRQAAVLGAVVGAVRCEVLAVGLDGRIEPHKVRTFSTPAHYPDLVKAIVREARKLTSGNAPRLAGLGISMPGLLHRRDKRTLASPNLHQTEGQRLGVDLGKELGLETVILQESHALCLAEQTFGAAREVDDFAMFDVSEGLGVGLVNNGRILSGHSGLAGELGHVTVELNGRPCGCGNRGCLETVATDTALAAAVSDRLRTRLSIDEAIARLQADLPRFEPDVDDFLQYLAAGLAAVINLFNPSKVFLHGRFLDVGPTMFQRLLDLTKKRALPPSLAECEVIRARGNKRLGAVAGIIRHLTTGRDEP